MSTETKSALASTFAVVAIIAALASATVSAITAVSLSGQIQDQRFVAVRSNCLDVNQRHDDTIEKLDGLIAKLPAAQRERAKTSRAGTVLLINALAPKRANCAAYAYSIVRP